MCQVGVLCMLLSEQRVFLTLSSVPPTLKCHMWLPSLHTQCRPDHGGKWPKKTQTQCWLLRRCYNFVTCRCWVLGSGVGNNSILQHFDSAFRRHDTDWPCNRISRSKVLHVPGIYCCIYLYRKYKTISSHRHQDWDGWLLLWQVLPFLWAPKLATHDV